MTEAFEERSSHNYVIGSMAEHLRSHVHSLDSFAQPVHFWVSLDMAHSGSFDVRGVDVLYLNRAVNLSQNITDTNIAIPNASKILTPLSIAIDSEVLIRFVIEPTHFHVPGSYRIEQKHIIVVLRVGPF